MAHKLGPCCLWGVCISGKLPWVQKNRINPPQEDLFRLLRVFLAAEYCCLRQARFSLKRSRHSEWLLWSACQPGAFVTPRPLPGPALCPLSDWLAGLQSPEGRFLQLGREVRVGQRIVYKGLGWE